MARIIQKRAQMVARDPKKAHSSCGSASSYHLSGNNCVPVPHNHVSYLPVLVYHACIPGAASANAPPQTRHNPNESLMIHSFLSTQTSRLEATNLLHLPVVALLHQLTHVFVFVLLHLEAALLAHHVVASAVVL